MSGTGEPISLRIEAVKIAIDSFGSDKKAETLSKVLSLSKQIIVCRNEQTQLKRSKGKNK